MSKIQIQKNEFLGRDEASLVARWLTDLGKPVTNGYLSVWRMTPSEIAKAFNVEETEVIRVARRSQPQNQNAQ